MLQLGGREGSHAGLPGAAVLLAGPKVRGKRIRRRGSFIEHP